MVSCSFPLLFLSMCESICTGLDDFKLFLLTLTQITPLLSPSLVPGSLVTTDPFTLAGLVLAIWNWSVDSENVRCFSLVLEACWSCVLGDLSLPSLLSGLSVPSSCRSMRISTGGPSLPLIVDGGWGEGETAGVVDRRRGGEYLGSGCGEGREEDWLLSENVHTCSSMASSHHSDDPRQPLTSCENKLILLHYSTLHSWMASFDQSYFDLIILTVDIYHWLQKIWLSVYDDARCYTVHSDSHCGEGKGSAVVLLGEEFHYIMKF